MCCCSHLVGPGALCGVDSLVGEVGHGVAVAVGEDHAVHLMRGGQGEHGGGVSWSWSCCLMGCRCVHAHHCARGAAFLVRRCGGHELHRLAPERVQPICGGVRQECIEPWGGSDAVLRESSAARRAGGAQSVTAASLWKREMRSNSVQVITSGVITSTQSVILATSHAGLRCP